MYVDGDMDLAEVNKIGQMEKMARILEIFARRKV